VADRKDRIRVQIDGQEYNVVGGAFQDMLATVKQINGRRFVSEIKVWQLPGPAEADRVLTKPATAPFGAWLSRLPGAGSDINRRVT
jgi:hypothetical protein